LQHDDRVRVRGRDCVDQRVLTRRQRQVGEVVALAFRADAEGDDDVGARRQQGRFRGRLSGVDVDRGIGQQLLQLRERRRGIRKRLREFPIGPAPPIGITDA
jgi:hypothetical protein